MIDTAKVRNAIALIEQAQNILRPAVMNLEHVRDESNWKDGRRAFLAHHYAEHAESLLALAVNNLEKQLHKEG